jgi:hypothetical protein
MPVVGLSVARHASTLANDATRQAVQRQAPALLVRGIRGEGVVPETPTLAGNEVLCEQPFCDGLHAGYGRQVALGALVVALDEKRLWLRGATAVAPAKTSGARNRSCSWAHLAPSLEIADLFMIVMVTMTVKDPMLGSDATGAGPD